ncbi:MAG: DUF2213 domain-containing protein [Waterburya sp.]
MGKNTEIRNQVTRCDRFELDSDGMLRARAKIARIGVQEYLIDGKVIREFRSEEEVKQSALSFRNKVLSLNHPIELIDASNTCKYLKGFVSNVEYRDGWLEAEITITHQDAIEKALTSHRYFSCGYLAAIVDCKGTWKDEFGVMGMPGEVYEYDAVQKGIFGDHVSLVVNPRAGAQATFFDSTEINIISDSNVTSYMAEIKHQDLVLQIDGEDSPKVASLVKDLKSDIEKLESRIDALNKEKAQIEVLEAKVDALTKEKADLDRELLDRVDSMPQLVAERVELWHQVTSYLDGDPDYKLEPQEIRKIYLRKEFPELATKIDSAEEGYIAGLYDIKPPASINDRVKSVITANPKIDSAFSEDALSKYRESQENYVKSRINRGSN